MMCHSVRKTSMTILQHQETEGWNFLFSYWDDCNKYRWRKGLFYCGTEINILKFRYILQIQLTTHTINSLEGLIRLDYQPLFCLVFYRVTLGTGLQQVKKLATPLTVIIVRHRIPWKKTGQGSSRKRNPRRGY